MNLICVWWSESNSYASNFKYSSSTRCSKRNTVLSGVGDEVVLDGVDVDVGEDGEGEVYPELRHRLLELLVEELRHAVERRAAAVAVDVGGPQREAIKYVGEATERPGVVYPKVPAPLSVDALHTIQE